jgi:hypothetical protein
MSIHTALTIAIAAAIFGVLVFIDVLRANRALPFFRPASPEPDEHEACHGDPEALRSISQSGVICHFHTTHEEISK